MHLFFRKAKECPVVIQQMFQSDTLMDADTNRVIASGSENGGLGKNKTGNVAE